MLMALVSLAAVSTDVHIIIRLGC